VWQYTKADREKGLILDSQTTDEQRARANGHYYYFDCLDAFFGGRFFKTDFFESVAEARQIAYDHEAVLTESVFENGNRVSKTIEHTKYKNQDYPYNGDVFADDLIVKDRSNE
jgi:hypothetical protein